AATLILLAAVLVLGALDKKREWQEGKLIDIISEPYKAGTLYGSGGLQGERIIYMIEAGQYVYAIAHIHFPRDKAMPVTVNTTVKFVIDKSKAYLLDEDGKEHELKFVKKTLKEDKK
ncbi:MAG TPA: hypothetical protein VNO24_08115, partial [Blastocatellia bacterium]|nr:hypothetical protein [Blastocatellia bacterium]